jgi:hypothetical protein
MDDWKKLLEYATRQLRAAHIPDDAWALGGGTVLTLTFQHRYSKDIDIFFTDPQFLAYVSPRVNDGVDDSLGNFVEQAGFTKFYFSEGEVDFILARQISSFLPRSIIQLPGIRTEHPVEIISKKIIYRAEDFMPRDVFDLSVVFEHFGKELQESCTLFSSVLDPLQARIQSLFDSGRLETELNEMDLINKDPLAAKHSFANCQVFLNAVREDVYQQENIGPSFSM